MKNKLLIYLAVSFCVFANTIFGQSAAQIQERYGEPIKSYSVSKGIWMTPSFTADGQVCMMRLYAKRVSSTANYLYDKMSDLELKKVLDKIVLPESRGQKAKIFGFTTMGGFRSTTIYRYEKIGFIFLVSDSPFADPIEKSESASQKTESETAQPAAAQNAALDEKMFIPSEVDIATIIWNKRTCAATGH